MRMFYPQQQQVAGPQSPPHMGYPAQLSSQSWQQVPLATPALPPPPSGYQYLLVPLASPHQSWASPNSIPFPNPSTTLSPAPILAPAPVPAPVPVPVPVPAQVPAPIQATPTPAPTTLDYPYILTGKLQMTLFTPDRSRALFIVNYPDTWSWSWSKSRYMTILRASNGEKLANAEFHSFTTSKADVYYGGYLYHFKKRFVSRTGLGSESRSTSAGGGGGVMMLWDVGNGEMMLTRNDGRGGIVARFVPRGDAVGLGGHTNTLEGRLELRVPGMTDTQFEELFVTLVTDMERRRRANEEWAVAIAVMGHGDVGGTAAVAAEQTAVVIGQSDASGAT